VVLCPDVAPCMDSRFDCRDLLQRSVIHYEAEGKASSAIISAPIQGVTTGTVASVSRVEDRSSGLVSIQAGAFILAASVARQSHHESTLHLFFQRDLVINFAQTRLGTLRYIFAITDSGPESGAGGRETGRAPA
jgi:hypothetical protein